ncbi:MAG: phosphate uptake regulator PhoU [Candidatus Bathyarchaeia archaeon]
MEIRKLQKTVDGTFFITLPKKWVMRLSLEKGSTISIEEDEEGRIIVMPYVKQEKKEKIATVTPSNILEREIIEKYLLGYDIIRIESEKPILSDLRERIKLILKRLIGLEIVEENSKKIITQCLVEPSLLVPEKIIRRLHAITISMQLDAISSLINNDSKLAKTVIERDEEVDRLYFLIVRTIRAAIDNPEILKMTSLKPIDFLDYRLLASFIESFADHSVAISEVTLKVSNQKLPEELIKTLSKISELINNMYYKAVISVLSKNLKMASEVRDKNEKALKLFEEFEKGLLDTQKSIIKCMAAVLTALKRLCELTIDIADLAVTK